MNTANMKEQHQQFHDDNSKLKTLNLINIDIYNHPNESKDLINKSEHTYQPSKNKLSKAIITILET